MLLLLPAAGIIAAAIILAAAKIVAAIIKAGAAIIVAAIITATAVILAAGAIIAVAIKQALRACLMGLHYKSLAQLRCAAALIVIEPLLMPGLRCARPCL